MALDCSKRKLKMSCSLPSRGEIRLPRTDKRGLTLQEGCVQKHPRLCLRSQRGTRPTIPLLKKNFDSPKLLRCKIWASKVTGEICINNGYRYFKNRLSSQFACISPLGDN